MAVALKSVAEYGRNASCTTAARAAHAVVWLCGMEVRWPAVCRARGRRLTGGWAGGQIAAGWVRIARPFRLSGAALLVDLFGCSATAGRVGQCCDLPCRAASRRGWSGDRWEHRSS